MTHNVVSWFCCAMSCALFVGCASTTSGESTRLTSGDYIYTISATQRKLTESDLFKNRNASSPKMTVTINKVINLTSDLIPEGEQWGFVAKVWSNPDVQALARSKNIITQIQPEVMERHRLQHEGAGANFLPPTHLMSAEFNSATQWNRNREGFVDDRIDQYLMNYTMTDAQTGQVVWSAIVEFKRAAKGVMQN